MNEDRQTGRTTAMLVQAAAAKAEGRRVVIVVDSPRTIGYCWRLAGSLGLNLTTRDFRTVRECRWGACLRGKQYKDVFVDHYVYELSNDDARKFFQELDFLKRTTQPDV